VQIIEVEKDSLYACIHTYVHTYKHQLLVNVSLLPPLFGGSAVTTCRAIVRARIIFTRIVRAVAKLRDATFCGASWVAKFEIQNWIIYVYDGFVAT
jgi:hypothetical protein